MVAERREYNPIIVALDGMDKEGVISTIQKLGRKAWGYKLGAILLWEGRGLIDEIQEKIGSVNLFVDLQFIGTPDFIEEAILTYSHPSVSFISCNAASGPAGIRTAVKSAHLSKILVGSVLSSLGIEDIKFIFETTHREIKTYDFARLAKETGAYGIYCSSEELEYISRQPEIRDIAKVVVGIRPEWHFERGYHKHTLTPKAAMERGADFIVIGSPITKAGNMIEAAEKILEEISYNPPRI